MSVIDILFKQMGVNPEEVQKTVAFYAAEFNAMKSGFGNAMAHFNNRFNIIEAQNKRILELLENRGNVIEISPQAPTEEKLNGNH